MERMDITSDVSQATESVLYIIFMFMIYLHTNFCNPVSSGSLVIVTKSKLTVVFPWTPCCCNTSWKS